MNIEQTINYVNIMSKDFRIRELTDITFSIIPTSFLYKDSSIRIYFPT